MKTSNPLQAILKIISISIVTILSACTAAKSTRSIEHESKVPAISTKEELQIFKPEGFFANDGKIKDSSPISILTFEEKGEVKMYIRDTSLNSTLKIPALNILLNKADDFSLTNQKYIGEIKIDPKYTLNDYKAHLFENTLELYTANLIEVTSDDLELYNFEFGYKYVVQVQDENTIKILSNESSFGQSTGPIMSPIPVYKKIISNKQIASDIFFLNQVQTHAISMDYRFSPFASDTDSYKECAANILGRISALQNDEKLMMNKESFVINVLNDLLTEARFSRSQARCLRSLEKVILESYKSKYHSWLFDPKEKLSEEVIVSVLNIFPKTIPVVILSDVLKFLRVTNISKTLTSDVSLKMILKSYVSNVEYLKSGYGVSVENRNYVKIPLMESVANLIEIGKILDIEKYQSRNILKEIFPKPIE